MKPSEQLVVRRFGIERYRPLFDAMQQFTANRKDDTADEIWFLQHEPVFTMGRNAKKEHLLAPGDIPVVDIDRGGQVTYHGPGQLIVYFLIDLKRKQIGIRELVSKIENSVVSLLSHYGITAKADPKAPGVYVDGAKIAALGLRVKQKGSYHGLSINVDMDLAPFDRINPCGYQNLKVIQLKDFISSIGIEKVCDDLLPILLRELRYNQAIKQSENEFSV